MNDLPGTGATNLRKNENQVLDQGLLTELLLGIAPCYSQVDKAASLRASVLGRINETGKRAKQNHHLKRCA